MESEMPDARKPTESDVESHTHSEQASRHTGLTHIISRLPGRLGTQMDTHRNAEMSVRADTLTASPHHVATLRQTLVISVICLLTRTWFPPASHLKGHCVPKRTKPVFQGLGL